MFDSPKVVDSACGLDIGSNTFSLTELRSSDTGLDIVRDISLFARLSEELIPGGPLKPAAISRGLAVLDEMVELFDLRSKPFRAVGTAALRMTGTPQLFTEPAREILGVDVEVISGEEEALLVSRGAIVGLEEDESWVVVDIGGQSTEICWFDGQGGWNPVSLPIGTVELAGRFFRVDTPPRQRVHDLRSEIRSALEKAVPTDLSGRAVGVAGTATTLASVELGLEKWDREKVHGLVVGTERLRHWTERVLSLTTEERVSKHGIPPGRADIFPAGLCVLSEFLNHLGRDEVQISANGLRIGVALDLLNGGDDGSRA